MNSRVVVCGGRDYQNYDYLSQAMQIIHNEHRITRLACGGAPGADTLIVTWASRNNIPIDIYYAEWEIYGRCAGPKRNQRIIDEFRPDIVVAFPGGRGTNDMIKRSIKHNINVIRI